MPGVGVQALEVASLVLTLDEAVVSLDEVVSGVSANYPRSVRYEMSSCLVMMIARLAS